MTKTIKQLEADKRKVLKNQAIALENGHKAVASAYGRIICKLDIKINALKLETN